MKTPRKGHNLRGTAFPRHQKKEGRRTNNDQKNATHETTDTQTEEPQQRSRPGQPAGNPRGGGVCGVDEGPRGGTL